MFYLVGQGWYDLVLMVLGYIDEGWCIGIVIEIFVFVINCEIGFVGVQFDW